MIDRCGFKKRVILGTTWQVFVKVEGGGGCGKLVGVWGEGGVTVRSHLYLYLYL